MKIDKREIKVCTIALATGFALLLASNPAAFAESEAGGFVFGGGTSESGGAYMSGASAESGGPLWGASTTESGGATDTGAESESGGVAGSASTTESGGETMTGAESEATYDGGNINYGAYVKYYGY